MLDKQIPNMVISEHAGRLEIHWKQSFVHPIFLESLGILLLRPVAREVKTQHITRAHITRKPPQGLLHVGSGWSNGHAIVNKHADG
jgi:hypothetical protein